MMEAQEDERPPVFSSWKAWYGLVIAVLLVQIVVYLLITLAFS